MSELLKVFKEKRKNVYSVEKILDKKTTKGITKYLIKWNGYNESDSTWEPLHHLTFIKEMVDEYEERGGRRVEKWRKEERKRMDEGEKMRKEEGRRDDGAMMKEKWRKEEEKEVRRREEDIRRRALKGRRRKEKERRRREKGGREEEGTKKEEVSKRRGFKEKRVGIIYDAFDGKTEKTGKIYFFQA